MIRTQFTYVYDSDSLGVIQYIDMKVNFNYANSGLNNDSGMCVKYSVGDVFVYVNVC